MILEYWSQYEHFPAQYDAGDDRRGWLIESCRLHRFVRTPDGARVEMEQSLYFDDPSAPEEMRARAAALFQRLAAAPGWGVREDQWASVRCSVLDGMVYRWSDDRKECSFYLEYAAPIAVFRARSSPEAVAALDRCLRDDRAEIT